MLVKCWKAPPTMASATLVSRAAACGDATAPVSAIASAGSALRFSNVPNGRLYRRLEHFSGYTVTAD